MKLGSIVLFTAVLLAACSSSDAPADNEDVTITFQIEGEIEENAVYESVVSAFESEHPGIDVELVPVEEDEDALAKLSSGFAAGDPPDVFLINYREYAQFAARGAIEPIGAHLEEAGVDIGDYYEQPIEAFTFDGELQCLPQNISSLVVYYNRAVFDEAGIAYPEPGWTFDEFRQTAAALTRGDVKGAGIEAKLIRVAPFVWSNGGEIIDDPVSPTRFTLDEPAAREAVEAVVAMAREDQSIPSEAEAGAEDMESRLIDGRLGMFLGSRKDTPKFREVLELDWDVAPLPVMGEPAGILHSDAYCIAAGGENIEAAVEFVSFALGRQGQTIAALSGRTVPSMKSVATSAAFVDPSQPPESSQVFLDQIPYIRRTPVIVTWPEIEAIADEIITRMFYEPGYTIDDGLAELEERTAPLFEEATSP